MRDAPLRFLSRRAQATAPIMVLSALGHYVAGQKSLLPRLIATTSVQKVTIAGPVSRLLCCEVFRSLSLSLSWCTYKVRSAATTKLFARVWGPRMGPSGLKSPFNRFDRDATRGNK